jgi:hypothetical protein
MSIATVRSRTNNHRNSQNTTGLGLRIRVWAKRDALDRELAAGAPASLSPELALHASQLVSDRRRRQLAGTFRRAIRDAHQPALSRSRFSIVRRRAVIDAEGSIDALIGRLTDAAPVAVEGMARLERLITDGISSPLYNAAEPGTLRREIMVATEALDPERTELPLAA